MMMIDRRSDSAYAWVGVGGRGWALVGVGEWARGLAGVGGGSVGVEGRPPLPSA